MNFMLASFLASGLFFRVLWLAYNSMNLLYTFYGNATCRLHKASQVMCDDSCCYGKRNGDNDFI